MQNNSLVQIKLKANEFIEDYQRQVTQREYQKQKLKQNIMLQIMSNRHKSQASQSIGNDIEKIDSISNQARFKKSTAVTIADNRGLRDQRGIGLGTVSGLMRSNSVPNANNGDEDGDNQNGYTPAEITFKMSKKNNNNFNFVGSKVEQNGYEQQVQVCDDQNEQKQCLDENQTLREPRQKLQKSLQPSQQKKLKPFTTATFQLQQQLQRSQKMRNRIEQIPRPHQEDSETERKQKIEEQIQINEKKAIFLTMDEDQSVQMSQENKNKNYAFDINMEKSQTIQDIEELRKKKIQEMEKKRQQRMEQFRKQEEAKRLNSEEKPDKRSNSYLKNKGTVTSQNSKIQDDYQQQNPKSKSRRKVEKDQKNTSIHTIQQSHYNMKPPQPQRSSYLVPLQDYQQQTPKTVVSENRIDKSKGKNTIFRESPKRPLDKSASKYSQDPKIQPKQRKNTFIKQSNKKLMVTALTNVCLPGEINRKQREKLAEVIEKEQSQFFVFLFKEYSRKVIKAIYTLDSSQTFLQKIYGDKAPQQIFSENVQSFYRFDSGSREFKKLDGCKSFSLVVHAIDLA